MKRCEVEPDAPVMQCNATVDIVFLIDGSGSLGQAGWDAEIKAAKMFVEAFSGTGANAEMSVILYSGPRTWGGVRKCFARNADGVNLETDCKIRTVTSLTSNMADVKTAIT